MYLPTTGTIIPKILFFCIRKEKIGGEHATTVNGNGEDPGIEDILAVAKNMGISTAKAKRIALNVQECVRERLAEYL